MSTQGNSSVAGALTNEQVFSLTYIYLAVLPLSILGSGSVIAVSLVKWKCCKDEVRPLFILSLSDFLAGSFLISTAVIQLLPLSLYIDSYNFCTYGVMLALMFYAVSYLMVVVYAFEVHRAVRNLRNARATNAEEGDNTDERSRLYLQYGLAWLVPLLLFLAQVITSTSSMTDIVPVHVDDFQSSISNQSGSGNGLFCSSCIILIHNSKDFCFQYLEEKNVGLGKKITFFVYLLVVMTCCTVLYCRLNLRPGTNEEIPLLSERDGFARMRTRSAYRTARFFQLSFVLCWSPAFILSVFSFTSMKPSSLYPLFILQALTVSLQGFLNSLAYGWSRQNFRLEVTSERTLLNSSTLQKAFFEESLVVSEE